MENNSKMIKSVMTLNVLAFMLTIFSCASRKAEPIAQPLALKTSTLIHGEQVFMRNCQKCHPNGEAGLGPAINSNPAPIFIKAFQVRHGLGVMPSFKKDEISKQEFIDLKAYLKILKRNKPLPENL